MISIPLLALMGLLSAVVMSVAGMGGGIMLIVLLASATDPKNALAMTAPAFLLGHAHRWLIFRTTIDRARVVHIAAGTLPGGLLGGWMSVMLPGDLGEAVMWTLLSVLAVVAFLRGLGWIRWEIPQRALFPAALFVGFLSGAAGAGVLLGPLVLAAGVSQRNLVGTMAVSALAMNVGRVFPYASGGWITETTLASSGILLCSMLVGNIVGKHVRARIPEPTAKIVTLTVLGLCLAVTAAKAF